MANLLNAAECGIIIVATGTPRYARRFKRLLGFELPGKVVLDTIRRTHTCVGLRSSVCASLVTPFQKHCCNYNTCLFSQALYVSLKEATPGHGSSWQQGGFLVLEHDDLADGGAVTAGLGWSEEYPGDWMPVDAILRDGLGINDAPKVSLPERLYYVIQCRRKPRRAQSFPPTIIGTAATIAV